MRTPKRTALAIILVSAVLAMVGVATSFASPAWWAERQVIATGATPDNYAPANLGQAKWMATKALEEMNAKLASVGGAGFAVTELFPAPPPGPGQTGYNATTWQAYVDSNYAPLNIGQLKNLSWRFYKRLKDIGYTAAPVNPNNPDGYPWTATTSDDDNYAPANLGQLKNVFSFDLSIDNDNNGQGNGLPDWWENYYFSHTGVDLNGNDDGDGLTNLQEYQQGSNPNDFFNGHAPLLSASAISLSQANLFWSLEGVDSGSLQGWSLERKAAGEPVGAYVEIAGIAGGSVSAFIDNAWTAQAGYTYRLRAFKPGAPGGSGSGYSLYSNEVSVSAPQGTIAASLPSDDLLLWLKADAGVNVDPGTGAVISWTDASGHGLNASAPSSANRPLRVSAALNGKPAVRFDGTISSLSLPAGFEDFDAGLTALIVVKPTGTPTFYQRFFDFGNGAGSNNLIMCREATSSNLLYISMSADGQWLTSLGAPMTIVQDSFQLLEATQGAAGAGAFLRKNGVLAAQGTSAAIPHVVRTSNFIGHSNWPSDPFPAEDIAEMLIFNRALSDTERGQWEIYLNAKYQLVSLPWAPAQPSALPLSSSQMAVSWSAGSPSVTGHRLERQNSDGSWSLIATLVDNVTSYIDTELEPGVTYSYRVIATNILGSSPVSDVASAATKSAGSVFPLSGLQFWLRADAGVMTDATGAVSAWADQSGGGYSAGQSIASSRPSLIANDVNGRPAVRFDSGDDYLDTNFTGMGGQELTFFVVTKGTQYQSLVRFQPSGSGNYLVYPWSSYQVFIDSADGATGAGVNSGLVSDQWNIGVATYKSGDQMTTYRNGERVDGRAAANVALPGGLPLNLGRYMGGSEYLQADVAEVLIYNRALSNLERGQIEDYLNEKYNLGMPLADADDDGLPNSWESVYGLDPSDPDDATVDSDDDGFTNLREYLDHTNPRDPTSHFPTVKIISPIGESSYLASASMYVSAEATGTIVKVELFADGVKIGESLVEPYGATWIQPSDGTHTLTAKATDAANSVAWSQPVSVAVTASAPKVTLISAKPAYTQASGKLIAQVLGVALSDLTSLTLNGQAIPLQTGQFLIDVTLFNGDNPFTLVATDSQGRSGQAAFSVLCATTGPTLTVSEPAASASIHYAWINVKGTVNAPSPLASLTVNGVKAFMTGNSYTAPAVPIVAGTNTLTAQATDVAGNISTASVNVTGVPTAPANLMTSPVALQANPPSGVGPLLVTLIPQINVTEAIQEIDYDFDGDGATEYTTSSTTPLAHTYSSAGEFYPVITVVTSAGSFSSYGGFNARVGASRPTVNVYQQPNAQSFLSVINPVDVASAADGSAIYVLSGSTATVTEFSKTGQTIRSLANVGANPTGLDIDNTGNVYVALNGNNQVIRLKPSGTTFVLDTTFNGTGSIGKADGSASSDGGAFSSPSDVAVSADGSSLYVADTNNNRIEKFTTDGQFLEVVDAATNGLGALNQPKGLCAGAGDTVYVADTGNNRLVRIDRDVVTGAQGTSGAQNGQFAAPRNVASNGDGVYVVDTGNNRVQNFAGEASNNGTDPATFSFRWSSGSQGGLNAPGSVACGFDLTGTTLYVADTANNRVVLLKVIRADTPIAVWQQMQTRMAALDIEGAVACFTTPQQEPHRSYFRALGAQRSAAVVAGAGPISPIFIDQNEAKYSIDKNIAGRVISFPVWFARENGQWKIDEF